MHNSVHMKVKKISRDQKWRGNDNQECPEGVCQHQGPRAFSISFQMKNETEGLDLQKVKSWNPPPPPLKKIKPLKDYSTWKEEVGGGGTEIHQERDITKWVFYKSNEVEFYILPHLYGVGKPSPRNDFKVVEGWYHSREQMRKQMKILPK